MPYVINEAVASFDVLATKANIQTVIEDWGTGNLSMSGQTDCMADASMCAVLDLTVFLVGRTFGGGIRLESGEILMASELASWLDAAQALIPGKLTVIVDTDFAGAFVSQLNPTMNPNRFLIASAGATDEAAFINRGTLSFRKFFFNQTLNGATLRQSFNIASTAIRFGSRAQQAELDDNGNTVPNELLDGLAASRCTIGAGYLLAGDDPLVNALSVNANLVVIDETIRAQQVTSTGTIEQVLAVVTQPDGRVITQQLAKKANGEYADRSFGLCGPTGEYDITVYAIDEDGETSLPVTTTANRAVACDDFSFLNGFE